MTPTRSQAAAIESDARNVLVLAGPGSGKTATIEQRVKRLAGSEDPRGIAIVTYTNAAARVIEGRLLDHARPGFVGTLHSFCLRHLNKHGNWPGGLRLLDDDEADELLERSALDAGIRTNGTVMRVLKRTRLDWMQERLLPETAPRIAVKAYYGEMVRIGALDYNSVLLLTSAWLEDDHKPRTVWGHLIVDEFQDAAPIDARIYAASAAARRFYVGDPMQAIFGFRGGDVSEITRAARNPAFEVHRLEENFRSGPSICKAAASLASHASIRPTLTTTASDGSSAHVGCLGFQNAATEALAIAGTASSGGPDGGMAVLTRTNGLAAEIADHLEARGVSTRRLVAVERPEDWKCAMTCLDWLAKPEHNRKTGAGLDRLFPGMTGDADKVRAELAMLGVSRESIDAIVARFDELPVTADLRDLHNSLKLEPRVRRMEGEGCFVGTIHSAKGMEFDVVVLAGFEDEVIPGQRKARDVDEERRVAYVGMTRARHKLVVTWSQFRQPHWRTGHERHTPSRFIAEAGLEQIE
jgi:superfamily I DNA/RNA helicase